MKKFLPLTLVMFSVLLVASCKKLDFNYDATGEGIGAFALNAPADNSELMLNSATPLVPVVFKWSAALPGLHSAITYTWKLDKKTMTITTTSSTGVVTTARVTELTSDKMVIEQQSDGYVNVITLVPKTAQ
jgi:hypothetical protein